MSQRVLALAICLLAMFVSGSAGADAPKAGAVVVEQRTFKTSDGEVVPYELGTLFVPENRADPASRLIGVGFARFRSTGPAGGSPTFHLPGGPGSSYVAWLGDDSEVSRRRLTKMLLPFRAAGDVVLIDQRGFSTRGDKLTYLERPQAAALDRPATVEEDARAQAAAIRLGLASQPGKDLSGYTVLGCADDVADLRQALGYSKVVLVGQSFGSQWSLAVMRRHPQIVARAILSGVEPLNNHYDMPSQIFASLQRVAWEADADPRLAPWLPPGGLMTAVRAVRERLARGPVRVVLTDKAGGRRQVVRVGLGDFQQALLSPPAEWPALVLSLYHGSYEPLARKAVARRAASAFRDALIGPLIDTSLGVTQERLHMLRSDPGLEFLGGWNFEGYLAAKPYMPTPDVGDAFRVPTVDQTPVLFVHGDWDISTPIENPLGLMPYFPNSRLLQVHRGGHIARTELFERDAAVVGPIVAFARTGGFGGLPSEAALSAPTFQLPNIPAPAPRQVSARSPAPAAR